VNGSVPAALPDVVVVDATGTTAFVAVVGATLGVSAGELVVVLFVGASLVIGDVVVVGVVLFVGVVVLVVGVVEHKVLYC
jgi:hypothetical protein